MSEKEKTAFSGLADVTNLLLGDKDEGTVLAITASYLAGKEAGKREAQAETRLITGLRMEANVNGKNQNAEE